MKTSHNGVNTIALIHRVIEFLWLATAFLVPLIIAPSESMMSFIQLPKVAVLRTLVSLMVMLWAIEWAVSARDETLHFKLMSVSEFKRWLIERPTRFVFVTSSAFMFVYILSALLSTSLRVSFWGSSANVDNYGLYNMLAYYLLFLVIAAHLRNKAQLRRLLAVIVAVGVIASLLGILEYLQLIPLGEVSPANPRIASTFGNTIFFAAFLVMTIPLSAVFFLKSEGRVGFDAKGLLWVVLISVQFLAFMLTLSRGPWVGLAVGLAGILVLGPVVLRKRMALKVGLFILAGLLLAFGATRALPTPSERNPFDDSLRADDLTLEDRLFSIYGQVSSGGLNNRIAIWKSSGRLIVDRPWFPSENLPLSFLRPITGYGPDIFWYVFPFEATESISFQFHAHNHVIHEAVEIGYLGAAAYLVFIGSIFVSGAILIFQHRNDYGIEHKLVLLMILLAMGARFIEQMVGIAKVGDFTLFWLLLAILVVLPKIAEQDETEREEVAENVSRGNLSLVKIGLASILIIALGWTALSRNVNHVRADVTAARAFQTNSLDEAISLMDKASELAPYVPTYYLHGANILRQVIGNADSTEQRVALAEKAYVNSTLALQADPLSNVARMKLANASLDLDRLGYEGFNQEAIDLYQMLIDSTPHMDQLHTHLWTLMAIAYIESDRPEEGVQALDRIEMESLSADRKARAHYLRGVADNELGKSQDAISSLNQSLGVNFEGDAGVKAEAHLLLSQIYDGTGDRARSVEHARLYEAFSVQNDS